MTGRFQRDHLRIVIIEGIILTPQQKYWNSKQSQTIEWPANLNTCMDLLLLIRSLLFWYSYIVIRFYQRGPRKPGPTPFEHLKMRQFVRHSSWVIRPSLNKWDLVEISSSGMILVSAYFRLDSHILFVPLTWRSSFFPCFFPCKLFNEAISGCRQHAGGMLHSAFHISVPSLTGWILLSRTKRSFGTSLWQWLEQMCLWHAMSLVVFFFFVFWGFSCNLSCRSLWHFKRTCLDFFWNNKAANEENMKDSGRFRNSIDFQVEIVIVCQNKPTSSIRSTSILFQTTKIWSPSPPWPASFIQWKAPKLAIPPWV